MADAAMAPARALPPLAAPPLHRKSSVNGRPETWTWQDLNHGCFLTLSLDLSLHKFYYFLLLFICSFGSEKLSI